MKMRFPLTVSLIIQAALIAISLWGLQAIPEGAQVPTQWGLDGQVNSTGSRDTVLMIMPAAGLFMIALFWFLPKIDPRKANLAASAKLWSVAWIGAMCVLLVAHGAMVFAAAGAAFDPVTPIALTLPLMFIAIGNYLGKTRSNFFAGVRTPWTLTSEYSWQKTNRLGGILMMAGGLAGLVAFVVLDPATSLIISAVATGIGALITIPASYVYWKADPNRDTGAQPAVDTEL